MQEKLNDLNYESKKIGLHINLAQIEKMRINNKSNNIIILEKETIRKLADFTYLGNNVSENRGSVKDVNRRIQRPCEPSPGSGKSGNNLSFIEAET
jgi:hypothetical protein